MNSKGNSPARSFPPTTGAIALVAMTLLFYIPALLGGFIWDDDQNVTENLPLRSLDGLRRIWFERGATQQYYPLVHTSFWIEYHLVGLRPVVFHAVNVALHATGALLLWSVLRRLTVPAAWLAAALFAFHPVHVESVAWITERKNVLSGVFYLAAFLPLIRAFAIEPGAAARPLDRRAYALGLFLFLCALFSKTVTCTLPAVLVLLIYWRRGCITRGEAVALVPLFVAGGAMGLLTAWIEKYALGGSGHGASGAEWDATLMERTLIAGHAAWFYVAKIIYPAQLTFIYPRWEIDARVAWQYFFPLAATGAVALLWFGRGRIGRGPLVAVLAYLVTIGPALGFFNVYAMRYSYVADHFQYHASLGLIVILAIALERLAGKLAAAGSPGREALMERLALGAFLLLLGSLTWRQSWIYHDQITLWEDTLAKNPRAWIAHNNLGVILTQQGKLGEALPHLAEVLASKPEYPEAHCNMAAWLAASGRVPEAVAHYRKAVELEPEYEQAWNNLGTALLATDRAEEALAAFDAALRLIPEDARAQTNRANALYTLGRYPEAIRDYERAIELDPAISEANNGLGAALLATGKTSEARERFVRALELDPNNRVARENLDKTTK